MAKRRKPREKHCRCCSKRDRVYRTFRWLGPVRAGHEFMRDHFHWPW